MLLMYEEARLVPHSTVMIDLVFGNLCHVQHWLKLKSDFVSLISPNHSEYMGTPSCSHVHLSCRQRGNPQPSRVNFSIISFIGPQSQYLGIQMQMTVCCVNMMNHKGTGLESCEHKLSWFQELQWSLRAQLCGQHYCFYRYHWSFRGRWRERVLYICTSTLEQYSVPLRLKLDREVGKCQGYPCFALYFYHWFKHWNYMNIS